MNAQQAQIELLLDQAADEMVSEGAVSMTTEIRLMQEGYLMRGLHRDLRRRLDENKD